MDIGLVERISWLMFYILIIYIMIPYRSFFIYQRPWSSVAIILDTDKAIVTTETSLSAAKRFIDQLLDVPTSIQDIVESMS